MIVSKSSAEGFLGKKLKGLGGGKRSFYVLSADGSKNLGGPYTRPQAVKRLQQVEYFKRNPSENIPADTALYSSVVAEARRKFDVWPSVYASSWVVREYKKRGGRYVNPVEGLDKWYAEKWVDLGRSIDSKGHVKTWVQCGRPSASQGKYPKCVPLAKAEKMTPSQRLSAVRRKRLAESSTPKKKGRKPVMVKTLKDNPERKKLYIYGNQASRKVAARALERRKNLPKSKRGGLDPMQAHEEGIGSGVLRARDIAAGKRVNAYQVKAFFDRHRGNYLKAKAEGKRWEDSKILQAWDLWGGEPMRKQVEAAVAKDKRARAKANPKPFEDRPHRWDEVLIAKDGKRLTRKQILDYYKRNEKKIWPFLKGQNVMVILAVKRNAFVRRRHAADNRFIKITKRKGIDDPNSFEYWIHRRVVEFHPTLMSKTTPILWLDLDMHSTKSAQARKKLLAKMRRAVPTLKKVFKEMGVRRVHVYSSGTAGGFHLEGDLDKPKNVDALRRRFTKRLAEAFADDDSFTTGIAKSGQIRLDTTTLHKLGSLRAPYSMTVMGTPKKPVKA